MKKIVLTFLVISALIISCTKEKKEVSITKENTPFNQLLIDYNEGKLQLDPIAATFAGDNRYNDIFPNFLSDEYQQKSKDFYTNYKAKLKDFKDTDLTESEQMSKAVLDWDCEMAIAQGTFKNDVLFPINQMWTVNLTMGQLASGGSAQPFATVKDYTNWLSRLEQYNVWLGSAEAKMRQGVTEGYVLPKSLIKKIIPQFESLTEVTKDGEGIVDVSAHLFYSPIKKFPESFTEK
ncbi:MAG: hypothetical protein ACI9Q3_000879, partial [Maribacter sp.]